MRLGFVVLLVVVIRVTNAVTRFYVIIGFVGVAGPENGRVSIGGIVPTLCDGIRFAFQEITGRADLRIVIMLLRFIEQRYRFRKLAVVEIVYGLVIRYALVGFVYAIRASV